jgi:O-6-methylguanine DNA methyltransferase
MANRVFSEAVLVICQRIPCGRLATYKSVATALGRPQAVRAVGNALNKNDNFKKIPCHRVVMSNGHVGGYRRGGPKKVKLLAGEGVKIEKGRIVEFDKYLFNF